MEAGTLPDPEQGVTQEEIVRAVRLIPHLAETVEDLDHAMLGVPIDGERVGGFVQTITRRLDQLEAIVWKVIFTILASNVAGGALVYLATRK